MELKEYASSEVDVEMVRKVSCPLCLFLSVSLPLCFSPSLCLSLPVPLPLRASPSLCLSLSVPQRVCMLPLLCVRARVYVEPCSALVCVHVLVRVLQYCIVSGGHRKV